jgi:hypothetical protein
MVVPCVSVNYIILQTLATNEDNDFCPWSLAWTDLQIIYKLKKFPSREILKIHFHIFDLCVYCLGMATSNRLTGYMIQVTSHTGW